MIYLMAKGTDAFSRIRENAAFDPAEAYYNVAEAFPETEPKLRAAEFPAGIREEFKALYSENKDVAGWLRIPGTGIDGPFVQAQDNDYYLRRNFYGEKDNRTRLFFADYRNVFGAGGELSKVTIIYGHHLSADTRIFAEIENYLDLEYYKTHPTVELDTLYGHTVWKVFGCFICSVDADKDSGATFYYWNPYITDEQTVPFCSEVLTRSWFVNPGVDIAVTDKLLCLSTCTYRIKNDEDNRCVLMARLVRPGEDENVDVSAAYANTNRRMPHAWYVQEGLQDPYVQMPVFSAG